MEQTLGNRIKNIIFYAFVAILVIYITIQIVAPSLTLTVFRFQPYVVISPSMEPVINVNDVVVVKNFDVEELNEEDIITFYADVDYDGDTEIVTHYIYSITESDGTYYIRTHRYYENEADYTPDPWILTGDDVMGLYNFHIPWIGAIVQFAKSPFGIAAILVNIGVIVGIVYVIKKVPDEPKQSDSEEK